MDSNRSKIVLVNMGSDWSIIVKGLVRDS